jgi:hypothetical protein
MSAHVRVRRSEEIDVFGPASLSDRLASRRYLDVEISTSLDHKSVFDGEEVAIATAALADHIRIRE